MRHPSNGDPEDNIDSQDCQEQRDQQLDALKQAVGQQAGQYLTQQWDADNNRYIVGINGDSSAFEAINEASAAIGGIINDQRTLVFDIQEAGSTTENLRGILATTGPLGPENNTPGRTFIGTDGLLHVVIMDTHSMSAGTVEAEKMSNEEPGLVNAGILIGHELGHVQYDWSNPQTYSRLDDNNSALRLENTVRLIQDPGGPTRWMH